MFAIFDSLESFEVWHTEIKKDLGYPLIGINQATGEPDTENITTEYTKPKTITTDVKVIAWVGDIVENLNIIELSDYPEYFPAPSIGDWTIPTAKGK